MKIWISVVVYVTSIQVLKSLNLYCPKDWTLSYGLCYRVLPSRNSWIFANRTCKRYGGRLVEPAGNVLSDAIVDQVDLNNKIWSAHLSKYSGILLQDFLVSQVWIGYNRRGYVLNDTSVGYWSSGVATSVDVGVWGNWEPKVDQGDCAYINITTRKWHMASCDFLLPAVCQIKPCPDNTFRCVNGRICLDVAKICDGNNDCGDFSDERNCSSECRHYLNTDFPRTIKYPSGNGQYPALSTCHWNFEGPPGQPLQLQIENLATEKNVDYLEFWEGETTWYNGYPLDRLSGSLTSDDNYKLHISRNNFFTVRFISDRTIQNLGFRLKAHTDFKCQWIKLENHKMVSGQESQNCENGCLNAQTCVGRMIDKKTNKCYLLQQFSPVNLDSCCDLYVKTCTDKTGLPEIPRIPNMGGEVQASSNKKQLYTPFYPSFYPGVGEIAWIIRAPGRHLISIEVMDVNMCGSDQVFIKDGDNPVSNILMTLTSSSVSGDIIISTGQSVYVYLMIEEHFACRGVLLSYKTGCDFDFTSNNGTIKSPAHGVSSYPPLVTCTWLIKSESGRDIKLTFEVFDLDTGDFVQVYQGENDQGVGFYSGLGFSGSNSLPTPVTAANGALYVVFKSRKTSTHLGFRAVFSSACQSLHLDGLRVTTTAAVSVVECNTGYYFDQPYLRWTSVTLTCQSNGQYDKLIPKCVTSSCPQQSSIINGGTVSLLYGDGTSSGSVLAYSCDDTFELVGVPRIVCQSGTWSQSAPACSKKKCYAPKISNGFISTAGPFMEGDLLTVVCNSVGYEVNGTNPFTCSSTANVPTCINKNECVQNPCQCLVGINLCVNSSCVDTVGSYYCNCPAGHKYSQSMGVCEAVKVPQTYFRAIENEDITLFCEIRTSSSLSSNAYTVNWSKDGNTVDRSQSRYINGNSNIPSLTISSVVPSDTGVYSCSVSASGVSQHGYTITLFVQEAGAPVVEITSTSFSSNYGGRIQIPCSVSTTLYSTVTWYFNGTQINTDISQSKYNLDMGNRSNVLLDITSLNKSDIGYYQCWVTNNAGTGRSGFTYLRVVDDGNYCNPLPCNSRNFMVCASVGFGEYTCTCREGYYGKTCSDGGINCDSFPCQHGSTCTDNNSGGYTCTCLVGWTGPNCDTFIDQCTANPCQNSGTCLSLANDYVCLCTSSKTGKNCDQNYNPCSTSNPCVPSNVCVVNRGIATCDCSLAGAGVKCYALTSSCGTIQCQNGGSCDDSSGQALCNCLPGFTGTYCSTNIDECTIAQCPSNSLCIDITNGYWCKCNNGLMGQNCDKEINGDLDLIFTLNGGFNMDDMVTESALFHLNSQALTISLWFRFTSVTIPGTIFTLYGLSSKTSTPLPILELTTVLSRFLINGIVDQTSFSTNLKDGAWHHFFLTWDGQISGGGRLAVYLDNTTLTNKNSFGTTIRLPTYGWVLFAATYSSSTGQIVRDGGLIGRISRFFLFKTGIYPLPQNLATTNFSYSIENVEFSPLAYVIHRNGRVLDYNSEVTKNKCIVNTNCTGVVQDSAYPSVQFCPSDQLKVTDGQSTTAWIEATFSSSVVLPMVKNYNRNDILSNGVYGIANVGYDVTSTSGNAAVCIYRVFVKSLTCSIVSPSSPVGGTQTCIPTSTGQRCTMSCPKTETLTRESPVYHSCSLYSMYGSEILQQKYVYPACADFVKSKYHLVFTANFTFNLAACNSAMVTSLQTFLTTRFQSLSNTWNSDGHGLCGTDCNNIPISITCRSGTMATIEADFGLINSPLQNTLSIYKHPNDILIDAISAEEFQFSNGSVIGSINPTSIGIDLTPGCYGDYPQLLGLSCVKCGTGTYHDESTSTCLSCPFGQYQNATGTKSCKMCTSGYTTYVTGATSLTSCYFICNAGKYINFVTKSCTDCPRNTYQTSPGSVSCIPCPSGYQTEDQGSASSSDCYDPAVTTTTVETNGNLGAATGESFSLPMIIVVVIGCLLIAISIVILVAMCCCRDRIPCCSSKEKVAPDTKKSVKKYEETDVTFVSYKLEDAREKFKAIDRQPIVNDTESISTDIVHVPIFLEKLDGYVSKRKTYISDISPSDNFMESDMPVKVKKPKKQKHRNRKIDQDDDLPRNFPPSDTLLPKKLPKLRKQPLLPIVVNLNASNLENRQANNYAPANQPISSSLMRQNDGNKSVGFVDTNQSIIFGSRKNSVLFEKDVKKEVLNQDNKDVSNGESEDEDSEKRFSIPVENMMISLDSEEDMR